MKKSESMQLGYATEKSGSRKRVTNKLSAAHLTKTNLLQAATVQLNNDLKI